MDFDIVDSAVSETGQLISTVATFGLAGVALVLVVWFSIQRRAAWPLIVLFGGALTCLMEPLFDHLYGLWFPTVGQWHLFTIYGIHEPIWLPAAYMVIYGALAVLTVILLERAPNRSTIWRIYGGLSVFAVVCEIVYVHVLAVYNYQGGQPFVVLGYPLFLGFVNALSPLMAGIVLWRLLPIVTGAQQLLFLTLPPMAFALDAVGSGMIYLSVRHSDDPSPLWMHVGAVTVVLGGIATVHLLSHLVDPVRLTRTDDVSSTPATTRSDLTTTESRSS